MGTARILLIDDHAMFRSGLRMVLESSMPDAEVFEAGTLNEAMKNAPDLLDVVLLDIKLPGMNGVDGIALLKRKWLHVPIIMLSSMDDPETVRLAFDHGAAAFISKADTADRIVSMIMLTLRGELPVPAMQGDVAMPDTPPHLTARQCEVLDLLCQGMSNKLIARQLSLSENTVRGHVQAILALLQVSSRSEAVFAARHRGIIN